ncbi:hypothetical protein ABKN59_004955 [Abortiporus biennis]
MLRRITYPVTESDVFALGSLCATNFSVWNYRSSVAEYFFGHRLAVKADMKSWSIKLGFDDVTSFDGHLIDDLPK